MSFINELKRRNVFKVGAAYVVMAWLLAQGVDVFLDGFGAPEWVIKTILMLLIIGFPIAVFFAWAFELTPEGIKKEKDVDRSQSITQETGRKLDYMIIGVLLVALSWFAWDKFAPEAGDEPNVGGSLAADQPSGREQGSLLQKGADGKNAGGSVAADQTDIAGMAPALPCAPPSKCVPAQKGSLLQDGAAAETVGGSAAADKPNAKSIAVLPFVNMSEDANNEYFSDGISEEILNALAKVQDLQVAGRTSSFSFKGENQDLRKIGEALGVAHILEGSVRKAGNKVRITAQLIRVDNGFHLWSESYDRELDDVFAIQDEIANAILMQLKAHLVGDTPHLVEVTRTNSEAFDLYLLAKQRMYERSELALESAAELLDKAIALDPDYAPAYAQRGIVSALLSEKQYGKLPNPQAQSQLKLYAEQALRLDPELGEGWAALGLYYQDVPGAQRQSIEALEKAQQLNPGLIDAANWLANGYSDTGQPSKAMALQQEITRKDPLYKPTLANLAGNLILTGQFDEAQALVDKARPFMPKDANILLMDSWLLTWQGKIAEGLPLAEAALALQPQDRVYRVEVGSGYLDTHQYEKAAGENNYWDTRIRALTRLGRLEEANRVAQDWAAQGNIRLYLDVLVASNQPDLLVSYIEERWPTLDEFELAFPPTGYFGYREMPAVAWAYQRTGNPQKFEDAMSRIRNAHDSLAEQGLNNKNFHTLEAAYYAMAENREKALEYLALAVDRGAIYTLRITDELPYFNEYETDPEFQAIQARMIDHLNSERAQLGLEPVKA